MAEKKAVRKATKTARPTAKKGVKTRAARPDERSDSSAGSRPASERITARIAELQDWRGEKLALVRRLVREADPAIVEEWKWETPVWSHDGIVCTGEIYKQTIKLTFPKGAFLDDGHGLFNAGFGGSVRRAIDLRAEDEVDGASFRDLIREAVSFNQEDSRKRGR